ncbi:uncharacterized protein C11orf42-like [Saccostrea cucullata]|uniref:uncharacterized protein C11orf42-like n=1 Tax=Saccostrea cuccullata TaxID=36930 RepID=UPI002ED16C86
METMDPFLYKELKNCDAKRCWALVKNVIGVQLLDDDVIMIPFLPEGKFYDLGRVIVKEERSPMQKLARIPPGALAIGKLTDFVKDEVIHGAFNRLSEMQKVETTHNPRYVFEESDMKHGVKKTVRVEILGTDHYALWSLPENNSLVVDFDNRGFPYVKKFYLLYDVFYARQINVYVRINDEVDEFCIRERTPIGFRLKRYKIQSNGLIGPVKDISNKKWNVHWIKNTMFRNPMDALPNVPNSGRSR